MVIIKIIPDRARSFQDKKHTLVSHLQFFITDFLLLFLLVVQQFLNAYKVNFWIFVLKGLMNVTQKLLIMIPIINIVFPHERLNFRQHFIKVFPINGIIFT